MVDGAREIVAHVHPLGGPQLRHEDPDEIVLGIDPELGVEEPAPAEGPRTSEPAALGKNEKPEPKLLAAVELEAPDLDLRRT